MGLDLFAMHVLQSKVVLKEIVKAMRDQKKGVSQEGKE
jgi:hypothetical protein